MQSFFDKPESESVLSDGPCSGMRLVVFPFDILWWLEAGTFFNADCLWEEQVGSCSWTSVHTFCYFLNSGL